MPPLHKTRCCRRRSFRLLWIPHSPQRLVNRGARHKSTNNCVQTRSKGELRPRNEMSPSNENARMRRLGRAQKINSTTTGTVAGGTVTPSKGRGRNKLAGVYTRTGGCRPATRGGQTRPWRQKLGYSAADLLSSADGARAHTPVCPCRREILPNAAAYGRSPANRRAGRVRTATSPQRPVSSKLEVRSVK